MRLLRSHLARIVAVWLACQFAVLAAAPLSLSASFAAIGEQALLCTCGSGGPDHDCPMHGRHHHPTTQDPHDCAMRSANPASDVALTSLVGGLGLIPASQVAVATQAISEAVVAISTPVLFQAFSPDSPPPKPSSRVVLS